MFALRIIVNITLISIQKQLHLAFITFFLLYLVLLLVSELARSVHDFSDMIFHLLGMVRHDVVRCHDGVLLLEPEAIDIHLLIYFDIDCIQLMS